MQCAFVVLQLAQVHVLLLALVLVLRVLLCCCFALCCFLLVCCCAASNVACVVHAILAQRFAVYSAKALFFALCSKINFATKLQVCARSTLQRTRACVTIAAARAALLLSAVRAIAILA
jgi:hypothetical protein